jgi:DNA mismatch endonuclease (patch repair protein)
MSSTHSGRLKMPKRALTQRRKCTISYKGKRIVLPYPKPSSVAISRAMHQNKARGTRPEIALRKFMWRQGLRGYRLNWPKAPGKPDIAYPGKKIAIFIHGCFWHRCPHCNLALPRANETYWSTKLNGNKRRDIQNKRRLKQQGWEVAALWECQLKKHPERAIQKLVRFICLCNMKRRERA